MVAVATAVGLAVTLFISVASFLRFAYRNPELHALLESSEAVIGFVVAFLVFGRFRQRGSRNDLILVYGLLLLAAANLFLSAVPRALASVPSGVFQTWAPVSARLLGAGAFAVSALAPERPAERAVRRGPAVMLAGAATSLVLIVVLVIVASPWLPSGIETAPPAEASTEPSFSANPAVLAVQPVNMALLAVAAIGFLRKSEREGDELLKWFAAGAALAAIARLNYLLFPSLYTDYVYSGDLFRLASYLLLLVGAEREITSYWRSLAAAAVVDDRRRMARELHDGLAQELAFIWAQSRLLLERDPEEPTLLHLSTASERALDESRRAIDALTQDADEPLHEALASAAEHVVGRLGARLRLDLSSEVTVAPAVQETLVRIVREAVTNAVRHGRAETVTVELTKGDTTRLAVVDDGIGFDPDSAVTTGSFGLVSMKERAVTLGGELRVASHPGAGTCVELVLP